MAPGWSWDNGEEPAPVQRAGNRGRHKTPLSLREHRAVLGQSVPVQPGDDGDKLPPTMQRCSSWGSRGTHQKALSLEETQPWDGSPGLWTVSVPARAFQTWSHDAVAILTRCWG